MGIQRVTAPVIWTVEPIKLEMKLLVDANVQKDLKKLKEIVWRSAKITNWEILSITAFALFRMAMKYVEKIAILTVAKIKLEIKIVVHANVSMDSKSVEEVA